MRVLDLFSGIGGFRLGMEAAGHQAIGWVEIDKHARKSYEAIHQPEGEWTHDDIRTIDYRDVPRADIWTFGFPCQDISVAGNQAGFGGERSSLFFAVTKLLRQIKAWNPKRMPSYLLIENVKNFLSVNGGWDFLLAQAELDEIGYDCEWQLLNSKDFGVPQNRERVFIVGHLRGRGTRKVFPLERQSREAHCKLAGRLALPGKDQWNRVYDPKGLGPTLTTMQGGRQEPKVTDGYRIRKLTPRECFRLQGFPDWAFDRAKENGVSDSQLYKQAGNSVTVNVIYEIAKRMQIEETAKEA
ncbi:DNA cytosine methyltransferase [Risungbinella massiliensis]|uniref:DNA cytosine methyltransferase n=1 Tax=Risungbinella massiliensis TaxID=1329796 RepID=UPI0005CC6688|nr:DNA cytosine methyltransferase [Risungbinella massiliensis]